MTSMHKLCMPDQAIHLNEMLDSADQLSTTNFGNPDA